jgi:hypothetical protein
MTATKRAPRPGEGRPSKYNAELAAKICERISKGESIRSIGRDPDMPEANTIFEWSIHKDEFYVQYVKAKEAGAEIEAEECEEIARDESIDVARAKLIVDTKKWNLSKKLPKRFGDKIDITTAGESLVPDKQSKDKADNAIDGFLKSN